MKIKSLFKKALLGASFCLVTTSPIFAFEESLANKLKIPQAFINIANKFNIDPIVMYSIATTETGINQGLSNGATPYSWTANICDMKAGRNCKGYWFETRQELYDKLNNELKRGNMWFDVGVMQVNWRFHRQRFGEDLWLATHPLVNMNTGARIISEVSQKHRNLHDIYAAYHAGIGFKSVSYTDKRRNQINDYAKKTHNTYKRILANTNGK